MYDKLKAFHRGLIDQNLAFLFPLPCPFFASFLHIHPRRTQLFANRLGDFVSICWHRFLWRSQIAYYFPLALACNLAIAQKCRQNFLMPKVLTPRLELFRGFTESWPNWTKVFRKLCGLKYGRPARLKASRKIVRMGVALLQ